MASIRNLKKHIKTITEDLKDECLLYLALHPEVKTGVIADMIRDIDRIGTELIFQLNHANYRPDGLPAKKFVADSMAGAEKKMGMLLEKMHAMTK